MRRPIVAVPVGGAVPVVSRRVPAARHLGASLWVVGVAERLNISSDAASLDHPRWFTGFEPPAADR